MKSPMLYSGIAAILVFAGGGSSAFAGVAVPSYARDVAPIFRRYCLPCHDSATRTKELDLESYAGLMKGGEHGPVIVSGKSSESRLVLMLEGKQAPKMPPAGPAPTTAEIARLRAWIDAGAPEGQRLALGAWRVVKAGPSPPSAKRQAPSAAGEAGPRPVVPVAGQIASVAFSPDGKRVAAGGYREVLLLDAATGKVDARLTGPVGVVTAVAFSRDGRLLAAAGGAAGQFGEVVLWSLRSQRTAHSAQRTARQGRQRDTRQSRMLPPSLCAVRCVPCAVLHGHRDAIYSVAFSPDARLLAAASYDRLVSLWPIGGSEPRMLKDHTDAVYAVAFSPDGRRIASASGDRTVKVWDVATGLRLFTLSDATSELYAVAWHPSGRQLAAAGADKMLRTWTVGRAGRERGTLLRSAFAHDGAIMRLLYAPDGSRLFTSGEDRAIKAWQASSLTEQRVYEKQPDWALALALSPDGHRLAVGRYDGSLAVYDAVTGRRLVSLAARSRSAAARSSKLGARSPSTKSEHEVRAERSERSASAASRSEATNGKPTVIPAALRSVAPTGTTRGATVTFTLKGVNISDATRVFFDDPAIIGKVARGLIPMLKRSEVKVDAVVGPQTRIGIHTLSLQTPMGTTDAVPFAVGGWPEVVEKEPNDLVERAEALPLPATAVGKLGTPGDVDSFRFEARAGQELVFQVVAQPIGSRLNSVLTLLDARGQVLARNDDAAGNVDSLLGYRFTAAGSYLIQIRDYQDSAGDDVYYRLNVGELPYVTGVFPLGVRRGHESKVTLTGYNLSRTNLSPPRGPAPAAERAENLHPLESAAPPPPRFGEGESVRVVARGPAVRPLLSPWGETTPVVVRTPAGPPINAVRVAVGDEAEVREEEASNQSGHGSNDTPATAQRVTVPVTVNGRIGRGSEGGGRYADPRPDADCYRFSARKGQRLVLEVAARRLGSPLDSLLEVLDAHGRPVERATLRCVAETSLTLSDRDANSQGFRIQSWADLAVNDLVFAGRELLRVLRLPDGPDDDIVFEGFGGRRVGLLDTTPEFHSLGAAVYKVTAHPPGRRFPPNGMPLFHVMYQNDDGGPLHGKDSRVTFNPPADGEYVVRVTDVQGRGGEEYAYRLTLRPPRPDFRLTMSPENPNVPRGSSVPLDVTAERLDGYNGPIEVRLEGLPAGFAAPAGVIPAGALSTTLTLSAGPDATTPDDAPGLRVTGRARIGSREVVRVVQRAPGDDDDWQATVARSGGGHHLAVLPRPDLTVTTDVRHLEIRPGGQVEVTAIVERHNGFGGRVPIDVQNLPFGVRVLDVGLNGVLVTEKETTRRFVLLAEPWARPCMQPFYAVARVESDPGSNLASPPILLTVAMGPRGHRVEAIRR